MLGQLYYWAIPNAVFRQEDGYEVGQIQANQIGPTAVGVVLVNIQDALPYFHFSAPVSQNGLALLILDQGHGRLPPISCQVAKAYYYYYWLPDCCSVQKWKV